MDEVSAEVLHEEVPSEVVAEEHLEVSVALQTVAEAHLEEAGAEAFQVRVRIEVVWGREEVVSAEGEDNSSCDGLLSHRGVMEPATHSRRGRSSPLLL